MAGLAGPVQHEVKTSPTTVIEVVASDGRKYEIRLAVVVMQVIDSGITNPLNGMPVFNLVSQIISDTKALDNA